MKILKMKIFQESACYKKPFAFKVAETYPLPPYSTVIGMFHKIIGANPGEYYPMNISILVLHMQAADEVVDNIYENILNGNETFTLGRNEDLVRIDEVKIIKEPQKGYKKTVNQYNAYIPNWVDEEIDGINYNKIFDFLENII